MQRLSARSLACHVLSVAVTIAVLGGCSAAGAPSASPTAVEYLAYQERIDLVVTCVREHGFEASSYRGLMVMVEYEGDEQEGIATQVEGECWEEVEQRFPAPPPLSLDEQYFYLLEAADCLRDLGLAIPEAPSLDTYVEQMSGTEPPADLWDPYYIASIRGVDTAALQGEGCPPPPWAR